MTVEEKVKDLATVLHDRSELEKVAIIVYAESAEDMSSELVETLEKEQYKRFTARTETAVLKYGSTGKDVALLQAALNYLGYESGDVDGVFGGNTQSAVYRYQDMNGLNVDGVAGVETINKIMESVWCK